ncbi:V-type ATPase subunit, partial [Oscillospiraceae bacterium OttesenSCG-928-G22]|nr:V-type ATPase subunit [Oscillospiraceae bacterium OttesenSCG-928-G22]
VPISFYKEQYNKDFSSLATAFHYKHMGDAVKRGIESYERTGTFSLLERLFDNALIERARQSKYIAFGPENLFSYLVSKENEIRQIRILLTCKLNGIDPALLRERLRENYA